MDIFKILMLVSGLALFLFGMDTMGDSLQRSAGSRLKVLLGKMTSNPFKGVLTGLGVTTVIQSSSATTVMVVSFVNAGLLTLAQAIGVIMGANIGTTVTAWMVSFLGFKADISILAIPLMALGFLFSISKKNQRQNFGELIVGFCLLFLGLSFMKESVPDLRETPQVLEFVRNWSSMGFAFIVVGILQVIRYIRYRTNEEYREKFDTESKDERNRFIANQAWAWAGYLFVLTGGVGAIVFKLMGREDLMMMASGKDVGVALVQPMAIVCIGGLLYATVMTLFVIPVVYDIVCKNELDIVSDDDLVILDI